MRLLRVLAVVAALVGAGCSGDDEDAAPRPDTSTPSPSTATTSAPLQASVASVVATIDPQRIEATLRAIVGERFSAEQRAAARGTLRTELEAAGIEVREEPFGDRGGVNVFGDISSAQPGAGRVVVAAHYDTVPGAPGADDNGSGVAAVLEVGRALAKARPALGITLAFFDLEELGLLGSRHHLESGGGTDGPVVAAFNLDMVGYTCATPGCQVLFPDIPDCMDVEGARDVGIGIAAVADADSGRLLDDVLRARDRHVADLHVGTARMAADGECLADTRRSDHAAFWDAGIPTVFFTDTANFRNPNYHKASDTLETIDVALVADVTRVVTAAVAATAGLEDAG